MKIIGLMPVRNEDWILPYSLPTAMRWVDELIILDHASTDDTPKMIDKACKTYGSRITPLKQIVPDWMEAHDRQRMLEVGRSLGGTHFALIDADEILTLNWIKKIRAEVEGMQPLDCWKLPWLHCWRSMERYRVDESPFGRARVPLVFCDHPMLNFAPGKDGYQIHTRIPQNAHVINAGRHDDGGVFHLQHVVWERLIAKQVLYKMWERLRMPDKEVALIDARYANTCDERGLVTAPVPTEWMPAGIGQVDLLRKPWQAAEIVRLLQEHGRERFAGLNLCGY